MGRRISSNAVNKEIKDTESGQIEDTYIDYHYSNGQVAFTKDESDVERLHNLSEDTYHGEEDVPDTWHLYAYCANDPMNHIDPTGHTIWDAQETFKRDGSNRRMTRGYGYSRYFFTVNIKVRNRFKVRKWGIEERVKKSTCWVKSKSGNGKVTIGKPHSSDKKAAGKFDTCNVYFYVKFNIPGAPVPLVEEKYRYYFHIQLLRRVRNGWYVKAGVEQERV